MQNFLLQTDWDEFVLIPSIKFHKKKTTERTWLPLDWCVAWCVRNRTCSQPSPSSIFFWLSARCFAFRPKMAKWVRRSLFCYFFNFLGIHPWLFFLPNVLFLQKETPQRQQNNARGMFFFPTETNLADMVWMWSLSGARQWNWATLKGWSGFLSSKKNGGGPLPPRSGPMSQCT